ncbi:hypothetical protein Csa_005529 [Cucumis sativus]|nr:hypothetical protein Csa_005529 [Cucumis sativus]
MAILSNFLNSSSPLQSVTTATTIESLESSIHDVVKLYERRRKWRALFFSPIPNNFDAFSSWRVHLITFLESTPAHIITIFLLVMDLIITVLELSSSLISCGSHGKDEEKASYFHWTTRLRRGWRGGHCGVGFGGGGGEERGRSDNGGEFVEACKGGGECF